MVKVTKPTTKQPTQDIGIKISPLEVKVMPVLIIGDAPLICHAWSQKAKLAMLAKQLKQAATGREAKDPVQDFKDSLYPLVGGGYGFPSVAVKAAAVTACTSVEGITKVAARQAFHILGESVEIPTAFDGRLMRQDMIRIIGAEPEMREDMVWVGMGTADIRYRGQFWPWRAKVIVRYNRRALSEEQIINLINNAGFGVGIGEWRPEKDGQAGLFHVATSDEARQFLKKAA